MEWARGRFEMTWLRMLCVSGMIGRWFGIMVLLLVIATIIMAVLSLLVAVVTVSVLTQHCNVSDGLEAKSKTVWHNGNAGSI